MVGFRCIKIKGWTVKEHTCTCPACGNQIIIGQNIHDINIGGGKKLKTVHSCSCGYSSNLMIVTMEMINMNMRLVRTCKDCGRVWRFNYNDINMETFKKQRNTLKSVWGLTGSPIGLMARDEVRDFNRCDECGSRRVKVEVE